MKYSTSMTFCLLAWTLLSCATTTDPGGETFKPRLEDDPRLGEAVDTVCFTAGLSGFYEIGNRAVVLRRSVNAAYVARTGYCQTLRNVEGLRLSDSSRCLKRGDRLEVYDQPFPLQSEPNDQPERCLIIAIHHWYGLAIDAPFYEE